MAGPFFDAVERVQLAGLPRRSSLRHSGVPGPGSAWQPNAKQRAQASGKTRAEVKDKLKDLLRALLGKGQGQPRPDGRWTPGR